MNVESLVEKLHPKLKQLIDLDKVFYESDNKAQKCQLILDYLDLLKQIVPVLLACEEFKEDTLIGLLIADIIKSNIKSYAQAIDSVRKKGENHDNTRTHK